MTDEAKENSKAVATVPTAIDLKFFMDNLPRFFDISYLGEIFMENGFEYLKMSAISLSLHLCYV
ncbi:hypothetical protein BRE01_04990 [Brevibacillus reuszeri]|uniref:Transposase n=1 Tax=Brevibacillus reuszeri TaxID=54915 RepID=A0ABQ0TGB4_9BACL|nr:hypothetical protein BRE01_04990 [Brevibacillus reuszeri]